MAEYRNTYLFTGGRPVPELEGKSRDELKTLLGGKGYGLYNLCCVLGLRCPSVLNLPTFHAHRLVDGRLSDELAEDLRLGLAELEDATGKTFGDPANPLLVSARSGSKFSMPGMMDTILNIGLNDAIVDALARGEQARFWLDSYRRLVQMYGDVVLQIEDASGHDPFEHALASLKRERGAASDVALGPRDLRELVERYRGIYAAYGHEFPQSPQEQVARSAEAVFRSWNNERAVFTRREEGIPDDLGTAVNIQEMAFGNRTPLSGTGVYFTRNKSTGAKREDVLDGTVLFQAQGEDVVAGIRDSLPIEALRDHEHPAIRAIYDEMKRTGDRLERHLKNMQDTEFTIEEKDGVPLLYWLQIRDGKRSARAESVIAVAMHEEGIVTREEAVMMVHPERFEQLLFPQIEEHHRHEATRIATGSAASPGAASGRVAFSQDEALELRARGEDVILVTVMTAQEDVKGMKASRGILTTTGTSVSHAAIMATAWGIPAVVGASAVRIDHDAGTFTAGGHTISCGDPITICGSTGEVFAGVVPASAPTDLDPAAKVILGWAREIMALQVRANAEAAETGMAHERGARGIGLFRTEHMFLGDRLPEIQTVLFGDDPGARARALEVIYAFSRDDFEHAMRVMDGHGVTIRLLDAPLHEFFPHGSGMPREENPMLGHRSVRMAITNPEIPRTQIRSILDAARALREEGLDPRPEIELPLVVCAREIAALKRIAVEVAQEIHDAHGVWVPYALGIMVETPAAAVQGRALVEALAAKVPGAPDEAHPRHGFASFGTNDLTQTTLAMSRDDADKFLPYYVENGFFARHPFVSLDPIVEVLVRRFVEDARAVDPTFDIFICGEHGGDVYTVGRLHDAGLTGISMSPGKVYRSILAAAQAQIRSPRAKER